MFHFTKQERTVLFVLLLVVLSGTVLHHAFARYPFLSDIVNLIDSDRITPKADLNTASIEELIEIPYIGEYTAANIVRYRQEHGPFTRIEEVKNVKGIRDKNYEKFSRYLTVLKR